MTKWILVLSWFFYSSNLTKWNVAESWFFSLLDFTKWIIARSFSRSLNSQSSSWWSLGTPIPLNWQIGLRRSPGSFPILTDTTEQIVALSWFFYSPKWNVALLLARLHKVNHGRVQVLLQFSRLNKQPIEESWYFSPDLTKQTVAVSWFF